MIRSLFEDLTVWGALLGVVVAVNTAIAAAYYLSIIKEMFFRPVEEGVDTRPVPVTPSLVTALGLTAAFTLVLGFIPGSVAKLGDEAQLVGQCPDPPAAGAPAAAPRPPGCD